MYQFKTTKNIFVDHDQYFNQNWFDSDTIITPKKGKWSYDREITIEDVDLWQVIYESGGGIGIYAAWDPMAEFYLMLSGFKPSIFENDPNKRQRIFETFYGQNAQEKVKKKAKELNIPLTQNQVWVDPEDMWLYTDPIQHRLISKILSV
jgi:hypothetical protein